MSRDCSRASRYRSANRAADGGARHRCGLPASLLARLASSLTARCLLVVGLYAAFIALSVFMVAGVSDAHLSNAFVSDAEFAKVEERVLNDEYAVLAEQRFAGMEVLVIDDAGTVLYASSSRFAQAIGRDDIAFVSEEEWDARFCVFEEQIDGETMYRVLWLGGHDETGFETVMGYGLLDGDLNVVEGTIFGDRTSITPEQFGLLNGVFEFPRTAAGGAGESGEDGYPFNMVLQDGQYVISRTQGENDRGEARILIRAVPVINSEDYSRVLAESQGMMLALVPIIAVATVVLFIAETRLIRSSTLPLVRAIENYSVTRRVDADPGRTASELVPVYTGFVDLTRRLERAQADKQRMISDVSHDIKTPLTVIRGYAQAFRDGVVPAERMAACADALCAKTEMAVSMVESLSEYAAAEHPEYQGYLQPADLAREVERICTDLESIVEQHGDTLEVLIGPEQIEARVDIELVRRAIVNLVSNACIHNASGTRVGVLCAREEGAGGHAIARVRVLDDGAGIEEGLASSIFDPFVTSNTARSAGKGTGLGLSIARRFVELNGGSLRLVEDPPDPWVTCFEITIPCA